MSGDSKQDSSGLVSPPRLREEPTALGNALELTVWHTGGARAAARARVWEKLSRPAPRGALWPKLRWSLGGATLAFSLVLAVWLARPKAAAAPSWQIDQLSGSVLLESAAGAEPAPAGRALPERARLRVGPSSAALLSQGELRLALAPGAGIELDPQPVLLEGSAAVQVPAARRFRLAAGAYVFEGAGGLFIADVSASRAAVRAESGTLRVQGAVDAQDVAPGASWSAGVREPASGAQPPRVSEAETNRPLAGLLRESAPPTVEQLRQVALYRAGAASTEDAAALLARAHAAESARQYLDAAALYAQLARLDGPRASAALYELARLRLRFLGQPAAALDALEEERARFPESPLAQEVALSAVEARLALRQDGATVREMNSFLERFSNSERAAEVRWLRASLELRQGDCAAARGDLDALAGDASFGGDALFAQAICARRAGDESAASARLHDYLRRYPAGGHRREAEAGLSGAQLDAP